MAVNVVHGLEVVQVGEDERERRREPLRARDFLRERVLTLAPVRDSRQAVDERLLLEDVVQARVLERDRCMRRERARRCPLLGVERRADEEEGAEGRASGCERQLEDRSLGFRVAALEHLPVLGAETRTLRAGGFDGRLHDHVQELLHVVAGRERLAEARDRVAEPAALAFELGEPGLELVRHVVERSTEERELVAAADGDALGEPPACDPVRCLGEGPQRADDRAALEVGDERDEGERAEQPEQKPVARARIRCIDRRLRAEDCKADGRTVGDRRGDERPEALLADRDRLGLPRGGSDVAGDGR